MSIKEHPPQQHVPVLLDEVVRQLDPAKNETYLDLTAGYGGHAAAVIDRTGNHSGAYLVDRDEYAIKHLRDFSDKGATVLRSDFVSAAAKLAKQGRRFDMILVDLGVSSPQLDMSERGFSFTRDGPLDMRMDNRQALDAHEIVNEWSKDELQTVICDYGEESYTQAGEIAKSIIENRPLKTTAELASVVKSSYRRRNAKIHPATRTFQAIRIAVNSELRQVSDMLPHIPTLLNKGGRVAIISFHSLEDRMVKRYFKDQAEAGYEAELTIKTKKPIDGATYDVHNPRARSAKLRAAVKK